MLLTQNLTKNHVPWSYWLMICILGWIFLGLAPIRIKPKEQLLIVLIKLLGYLHWVTDTFKFQGSLKQTFECCVLESHWRVVFVATLQGSWRQRAEVTCWALRSSQVLGAGRSWPSHSWQLRHDRNYDYCAMKFWMDFILELLTTKHTTWHDQHSPSHQW